VEQTETAEQARKVVAAARFPFFGGHRSFPPFAHAPGMTDGGPDGKNPLQVWSENGAVIMQIESKLGCENAMEIAAVEGGELFYA
jgi:2-keto-3-deoxy-L-rhamnonate aldolase RhmA